MENTPQDKTKRAVLGARWPEGWSLTVYVPTSPVPLATSALAVVGKGGYLRTLAPGFSLSGFSSAIEKKLPSLLEDYMISIKGIIYKVASRKLAVTAAAATGTIELT